MKRRAHKKRAAIAILIAVIAGFAAGWVVGVGHRQPPWLRAALVGIATWVPAGSVAAETSAHHHLPPVDGPEEARLLFVGDVLPLGDRDYFHAVQPLIAGADLAICNLECPLSTYGTPTPLKFDEKGRILPDEYLFRAPPVQAERLAAAGFDGVTLANNHIMDYGSEALLETLQVLDAVDLKHTGAGPDQRAARRPMIFEVNGQTIAVIAYCSDATLPGSEHFAATDSLAGTVLVHGLKDEEVSERSRAMLDHDIVSARRLADFVVVALHWGQEGSRRPTPAARNLAHRCIDMGADLVIGHHPHVLHGIEIYRGKPIAYSLGNFAFPTPWETNHFTAALELRIKRAGWTELVVHPIKLRFKIGDPAAARGADLQRIVSRVMDLSAELGTVAHFVQDNGRPRVVITNPEPSTEDFTRVKAEEHFYVEPHGQLAGMSTVHFLAWDIEGGEQVTKSRSVVVASELAQEVLDIFREIYLDPMRFPIHDIVGYNYRTVTGGARLSNHALGRAIDINRAENPMVQDGRKLVHPDEPPYEPGEWRPGEDPYSITPDGTVVRAFKARGWRWGGDWTSCKDYQHFDRPLG